MKVAIAMSGGVDSSVAAYLLKQQGHQLIGVFMHLWFDSDFKESENKCCSLESREDARKVANKLGFPLYTLNVSNDFKKTIVNAFINGYKKGITPNPCVACNEKIKFALLLKKIRALGCDYLATGHYVKLKHNRLFKADDVTKDQSYFLYRLKPMQIESLIFPLAKYKKNDVKKIALKNNLIPTNKKESQDVCFVPKNKLNIFLKKYINSKKACIIETNTKKILGYTDYLFGFTIGQKAGIGGKGPYYVVKKDYKKNILHVSNNIHCNDLFKNKITIKNINWISGQKPSFPLKCKAKSRYGQPEQDVIVENNIVYFLKKQRALTPGQSIVFYKKKELLGGGIII